MNICLILSIYLAMAQSHMDVPANHVKIAEGGKYLEQSCEKEKKAAEKKVSGAKIEKAKKE